MKNQPTPRPRSPALKLWLATAGIALAAGVAQQALAADPGTAPGAHAHHRGAGGPGGMGGPMGMAMGPRQIERMLDAVNATAEQRTQIQSLLAAVRPEMEQQRAARRALHEQARAVWTQPTVDANAVEALRQQMAAQHDQSSRRMTQLMLDVSRVLTPAQRQQLAALREQHRGAHGGHPMGGPGGPGRGGPGRS